MTSSRYTSASGSSPATSQSVLIDVRASTQNFAQDLAAMRSAFDGTVVSGFTSAGSVLENALVGAVKKGSSSFIDLESTATRVINSIAASAVQSLFGNLSGGSGGGGTTGLGGLIGGLFGLPGRATGGPVSPGQAYVVGERGPELFVPTAAGSVAANAGLGAPAQDVRVAITINAPSGTDAPQALQRSSRQVAAAVRRALTQY